MRKDVKSSLFFSECRLNCSYQFCLKTAFSPSVRSPLASGHLAKSVCKTRDAATVMLSDSAKPKIGTKMRLSAAFKISSEQPEISLPKTIANFSGMTMSGVVGSNLIASGDRSVAQISWPDARNASMHSFVVPCSCIVMKGSTFFVIDLETRLWDCFITGEETTWMFWTPKQSAVRITACWLKSSNKLSKTNEKRLVREARTVSARRIRLGAPSTHSAVEDFLTEEKSGQCGRQ